MYDTIWCSSPYLNDSDIAIIKSFCTMSEGIVIETGEQLYSFTKTDVDASHDYRISVQICDFEYIKLGKIPQKIPSSSYIIIKCSLHKLLLGHNVFGGPNRIHLSVKYLVNFLSKNFGVELPNYLNWNVDQIDVANIYNLGTLRNAAQFNIQLKNMKYPRRKEPLPYPGGTGLFWKGTDNTTKFYLKNIEFRKHDYRRIKKYYLKKLDMLYSEKYFTSEHLKKEIMYKERLKEIEKILENSKGILRIEVAIHKCKLKKMFKNDIIENENIVNVNTDLCVDRVRVGVKVYMINDDELERYYGDVMKKLFSDCTFDENVIDVMAVRRKMESAYGSKMANSLFGTWSSLNVLGYDVVKTMMAKATFMRHLKKMRELGIKWNNVSIKINNNVTSLDLYSNRSPIDFFDYMMQNLCISGECETVRKKLDQVA